MTTNGNAAAGVTPNQRRGVRASVHMLSTDRGYMSGDDGGILQTCEYVANMPRCGVCRRPQLGVHGHAHATGCDSEWESRRDRRGNGHVVCRSYRRSEGVEKDWDRKLSSWVLQIHEHGSSMARWVCAGVCDYVCMGI